MLHDFYILNQFDICTLNNEHPCLLDVNNIIIALLINHAVQREQYDMKKNQNSIKIVTQTIIIIKIISQNK